MAPKLGRDGKYIDRHSRTVEDAAWFEKTYNSEPAPKPDPSDYAEDHSEACPECGDDLLDDRSFMWCSSCGWEDGQDDPCGCSDPCCPCGGPKSGIP